jgi:hypothetical protein
MNRRYDVLYRKGNNVDMNYIMNMSNPTRVVGFFDKNYNLEFGKTYSVYIRFTIEDKDDSITLVPSNKPGEFAIANKDGSITLVPSNKPGEVAIANKNPILRSDASLPIATPTDERNILYNELKTVKFDPVDINNLNVNPYIANLYKIKAIYSRINNIIKNDKLNNKLNVIIENIMKIIQTIKDINHNTSENEMKNIISSVNDIYANYNNNSIILIKLYENAKNN